MSITPLKASPGILKTVRNDGYDIRIDLIEGAVNPVVHFSRRDFLKRSVLEDANPLTGCGIGFDVPLVQIVRHDGLERYKTDAAFSTLFVKG